MENFQYRFIFPAEYTGELAVDDLLLWMRVDPPILDGKKKLLSLTAHSHAEYELFLVEAGALTLDTPRGPMRFSAGELAVVPPDLMHTMRLSEEAAEYGSLHFRFSPTVAAGGGQGSLGRLRSLLSQGEVLRFLAPAGASGRLFDALALGGMHPPLALFALFLLLLEKDTEHGREGALRGADLLYELNEVICGRFMEPQTARKIASSLFISERKLSRLVRRHYGCSLHKLLQEKRIAMARSLLDTTDLTVEEIAATVGYSSKVSLYAEFKRRYGTTPARYRRERGLEKGRE